MRTELNGSLSLAEALTLSLEDAGVSHVFGVSGANIEVFHDALFRLARRRITSLLCKSERGASFMADGFARQSGKIAVCCSTSGGGMMNLAVGIAEARNSGIPMLAIVGCPPSQLAGCGAFQDASGGSDRIDAVLLWRAIAKYSVLVTPDHFWQQLETAWQHAYSGCKGPSVLLIPSDYFNAQVTPPPQNFLLAMPAPSDGDKADYHVQLAHELKNAKRPLIVAGPSVSNNTALHEVSRSTGIPVATTMESTAAFPHQHPGYVGILGVAGHSNVHEYLMNCDLLISLGSQLEVMTRGAAMDALSTIPTLIFHDSIASAPINEWTTRFSCDANSVVAFIATLATSIPLKFPHLHSACPDRVQSMPIHSSSGVNGTGTLSTSQALKVLQSHVVHFNQFLFDAGNCAAAAAHYLTLPDHAQSHIALGMGGMGYAIAASIGMRLSQPEGASMVICGDGAFLMEGMEIHTAIEQQLNIVYVIFNDSQHGMCVSRQRHFFADRLTCTTYSQVNFTELSRGLAGENQCYCAQATDITSLERCLNDYLSLDTPLPCVIELLISQEELPAFYPLNRDILAQPSTRKESTSRKQTSTELEKR